MMAAAQRETFERGTEPDFSINDIARWEDAGDGMIRIYVASRRGNLGKIEYSFHCTPDTLGRMARRCMEIADEFRASKARVASRGH